MEPAAAPGWHVGPPDFVGVGAAGASTGWWHAQIERHPGVTRAEGAPREVRYFDGAWTSGFTDADTAAYATWFPRPEGAVAGEWSPSYLADFWALDLLARSARAARILVLLRDPIERFAANLARTANESREPGAQRQLDDRDYQSAFQRGLYAEPIRRLFAAFPRGQVLLLQEEACRADVHGQLTRTLEFIGLPEAPLAPGPPAPPVSVAASQLPPALRMALVEAYKPDLEQLAELAPEIDQSLWPTAGESGRGT
jgi:hypothetical protein